MRRVLAAACLVWGALASGCGDDGGGGTKFPGGGGSTGAAGAPSTDPAAPQKCSALGEGFCGRLADCVSQIGCEPGSTRQSIYDECIAGYRSELNCSKAVSVTSTYDACMSDISAIPCSAVGTASQCMVPALPANCGRVIQVTQ